LSTVASGACDVGLGFVGCPGCGATQEIPLLTHGALARCAVCGTLLERTNGSSLTAGLAVSAATLVLLACADLAPICRVDLLAASRESHIFSGAAVFWREGWPLPAVCVFLFAIAAPLARFGLLTASLALIEAGRRPPWLGRMFRHADGLTVWAMPEVLLLGLWVAYGRLHALFEVRLEAGAAFLAAGAIGALMTRALIDRRAVWRAISPDAPPPRGEAIACPACELLAPITAAGSACPRCGDKLEPRAPESLARTLALICGGMVLYLPANLLPMAATLQLGKLLPYTVLEGVRDLAQANLWGLAVLVFCASFAIPLLKLAGLAWLIGTLRSRAPRALRVKTRVYGVIREIGRWSMVDIFAIASFAPLMQFGQLAGAQSMSGASAFLMVVVLTMLATDSFDPRLMWDRRLARA